jgi:hypothetical protein
VRYTATPHLASDFVASIAIETAAASRLSASKARCTDRDIFAAIALAYPPTLNIGAVLATSNNDQATKRLPGKVNEFRREAALLLLDSRNFSRKRLGLLKTRA